MKPVARTQQSLIIVYDLKKRFLYQSAIILMTKYIPSFFQSTGFLMPFSTNDLFTEQDVCVYLCLRLRGSFPFLQHMIISFPLKKSYTFPSNCG